MLRFIVLYVLALALVGSTAGCGDSTGAAYSGGNAEPVPVKIRFLNLSKKGATVAIGGVTRRIQFKDDGSPGTKTSAESPESAANMTPFDPAKDSPDKNDTLITGGHASNSNATYKTIELKAWNKANLGDGSGITDIRTDMLSVTVKVDTLTIPVPMVFKAGVGDFNGDVIVILTNVGTTYTVQLFAEFEHADAGTGWGHVTVSKTK